MSSRHFTNKHIKIQEFADELQNDLDCPGIIHSVAFDENTKQILNDSQRLIEIAGRLAKEIEWLYSGDIDTETFVKRFNEIGDEYDANLAAGTD